MMYCLVEEDVRKREKKRESSSNWEGGLGCWVHKSDQSNSPEKETLFFSLRCLSKEKH